MAVFVRPDLLEQVRESWPELYALWMFLESLSAEPYVITVQDAAIQEENGIVSLGPGDTSPLHMFEDGSGITEAAYEVRWGHPWGGW